MTRNNFFNDWLRARAIARVQGEHRREDVREAVVAFANTVTAPNVAALFIGIGPDGRPTGTIADADVMQRRLAGMVRKCYPPVDSVQYQPLLVEGQTVVAVVVGENRNGPYFSGPAFVRRGTETVEASREMFERLIEDRHDPVRLLRPWVGQRHLPPVIPPSSDSSVNTGAFALLDHA